MNNLVNEVYQNKNVADQYNLLDDDKKLEVCNEVAAELAKQLDVDNKEGISPAGKFFQLTSAEYARLSIKTNVGLDRMVKHNLDENEEFNKVIEAVSKAYSSNATTDSVATETVSE